MIWFCEGHARRAGMDLWTVGTPTWSTTPACLLLWSALSPESGWHVKKRKCPCTSVVDWSAKRYHHAIDSQRLFESYHFSIERGPAGIFSSLLIWNLVRKDVKKSFSPNESFNVIKVVVCFAAWEMLGAARISSLVLDRCLWSSTSAMKSMRNPVDSETDTCWRLLAWSHYRREPGSHRSFLRFKIV